MQVPTIPETGIDSDVLDEITDYTSHLNEHIMRYGNSVPGSSKADYAEEIVRDFKKWYNKHPEVQSIECVKNALSMTSCLVCVIEKEEEEKPVARPFKAQMPMARSYRKKPRETLDDDESDSESEDNRDNQPDDYYQ
jgi:hypothetical protein